MSGADAPTVHAALAPSSVPALTVTLTTTDIGRGLRFWDAVLAPLGLVRVAELVDEEEDDAAVEAAAWDRFDGPGLVWLVASQAPTTGLHMRLPAPDRTAVEAFHAAGLIAGGTEHAPPRRWPIYRRGEFSASVRDPDGNLVEAVARE